MNCFCYDNDDICNKYKSILNENPCEMCDDLYNFILYLKYTQQQTYTNVIEKFVIYNKRQELFLEMKNTNKIYRTIFSYRKNFGIIDTLWVYDIPDKWTNNYYGKFRLI